MISLSEKHKEWAIEALAMQTMLLSEGRHLEAIAMGAKAIYNYSVARALGVELTPSEIHTVKGLTKVLSDTVKEL